MMDLLLLLHSQYVVLGNSITVEDINTDKQAN
jgi:hypothetical protein